MQTKRATFGVKFLLFILFFLGILLNAWVIMDAGWFHILIPLPKIPGILETGDRAPDSTPAQQPSSRIDRLRQSVVLVIRQNCNKLDDLSNGTGFVVKADGSARYVATNAHVVRDAVKCSGIHIIDHKGRKHKAAMVGISLVGGFHNDMTILKLDNIPENDLPPLALLDSSKYEAGHDGEKIVTIGYPVIGTASTQDKASVSSEGQISQYDTTKNCFIASGLSLNPGNSGGPVFLVENHKVLGIAVAKANIQVAENVGIFIPINRFKNFFKDKTGKELSP